MKRKIKYDSRNYRLHSDGNKSAIRESLQRCGAGRSVVIDADDELIAGNGVFEQAEALGIPVRVIETDGTELVAVKRTDLHTGDERRKLLAFADNATADKVEWNVPELTAGISADDLATFHVELPEVVSPDDFGEDFELPQGDKPPFSRYCFMLAAEQLDAINEALKEAKKDHSFGNTETFGNTNTNGNALYYIVKQWAEQRR